MRFDDAPDEIEKCSIGLSPGEFVCLCERYPLKLGMLGTRESIAFDDRLIEMDFDDAFGLDRFARGDEIGGVCLDFEFFE